MTVTMAWTMAWTVAWRRGSIRPLPIALGAASVLLLAACTSEEEPSAVPRGASRGAAGASDRFRDVAREVGITRRNVCGSPGLVYIFENIGSGAALFDADADGRLDVYVANAGTTRTTGRRPRRVRLVDGPGPSLYRQRPDGSFEDRTEEAGLRLREWGTGVAVGDVDGDGDLDLFVGAFGASRLYLNRGDGTFDDATERAGLSAPGYTTSAAFLDYDRDGDLDLYRVEYVVFDLDHPPNDGEPCLARTVPVSCPPPLHDPKPDSLWRNRGDGTFEDVTRRAGLHPQPGAYGLGVAVGDLDRDGWPDIYVTNDTQANFLWRNRGDGTFEDEALLRGVALSDDAQGQAGMGVAIADVDGDGWLDIQVNNFSEEPCAYYRNNGDGTFRDETARSGLGSATFMSLSWGARFVDVDLDGWLDLITVSGHVQSRADELGPGHSFPQRIQVFRGAEGGRFRDVACELGTVFDQARNHRGLATGDVDGDGDEDLLVTLLDGPPLLLRNELPPGARSIGFVLEGRESTSEGAGARVEVDAGGRTRVREAGRSGSYLSASDGALIFGLGAEDAASAVRVLWPSGRRTEHGELTAGRLYRLREGGGPAEVVRTWPARGAAGSE